MSNGLIVTDHSCLGQRRDGLALVPRCATNVVFKDVVFRDIDLGEGVQSELHLVWRSDNDNPACRMLLEAIRAAVRADER